MVAVTLHNTIGALEVGVLVAVFLFGIVSLQMFYYVETFGADDRKTFRAMAAAVWVLELAHTMCICAELYRGTVVLYGRMDLFVNYPFMGAATILSGFITWIVHIFFCLRVYKALPNPLRYIGPVCAMATTLRTIGGVYLGTRIIMAETLAEYQAANGWLVSATLAGGAAIDVIIAISMVHFLVSKKQTGLGHVAKLVDRLVAYAIRTGVLTSITAITVLVLFQAMGHNFVWAGFYVVLAKMYSNSFFSALNERERLRSAIASSSADADSRMLGKNRSAVDPTNFRRRAGPEISIEMKTTVIHDDEENLKHIPYDGRRL